MELKNLIYIYLEELNKFDSIKTLNEFVYEFKYHHFNKEFTKYLVFMPAKTFTNFEEHVTALYKINKINSPHAVSKNLYIIPYFAGISSYDLWWFFFKESPSEEYQTLNREIDFQDVLPRDYICRGGTFFLDYLYKKMQEVPVFRGNNNFLNYENYFSKLLKSNHDQFEKVFSICLVNQDKADYKEKGPIMTIMKNYFELEDKHK